MTRGRARINLMIYPCRCRDLGSVNPSFRDLYVRVLDNNYVIIDISTEMALVTGTNRIVIVTR